MENPQTPSAVNTANIQWQTDGWRTRSGCRPRLPACGSPTHGSEIWSAYSCGWDAWESRSPAVSDIAIRHAKHTMTDRWRTRKRHQPSTRRTYSDRRTDGEPALGVAAHVYPHAVIESGGRGYGICKPPTHQLCTTCAEVQEIVSHLRTAYAYAPPAHHLRRDSGICKPPTQALRAHSEVTGSTSPTKLASRSRHLRSANLQCLTAVGSFSCQDQCRRLLKIRSLYKFTYLLTMRGSLGRPLSLTLRSDTPNIQ